jgi:hypothetical protein
MLTTQVTLTDQQAQALRAIAQRTGKTEKEVIAEAVGQFIVQRTPHDQQSKTLRDENISYLTPTARRYDVEVMDEGRVELQVPFPRGSHLVVYVAEEPIAEFFDDLLMASSTSLDFWDNALDDEDWNNA